MEVISATVKTAADIRGQHRDIGDAFFKTADLIPEIFKRVNIQEHAMTIKATGKAAILFQDTVEGSNELVPCYFSLESYIENIVAHKNVF